MRARSFHGSFSGLWRGRGAADGHRDVGELSDALERLGRGLCVLALRTENLESDLPRAKEVEELRCRLQHVEEELPREVEEVAERLGQLESSLLREVQKCGASVQPCSRSRKSEAHRRMAEGVAGEVRASLAGGAEPSVPACSTEREALATLVSVLNRLEEASRRTEKTELTLAAEVDRCQEICSALASRGGRPGTSDLEELATRVGWLEASLREAAADDMGRSTFPAVPDCVEQPGTTTSPCEEARWVLCQPPERTREAACDAPPALARCYSQPTPLCSSTLPGARPPRLSLLLQQGASLLDP